MLRENPRCPAEVRLGIASCLYRSGKLQKAAAAYNRYVDNMWGEAREGRWCLMLLVPARLHTHAACQPQALHQASNCWCLTFSLRV